ncbi:MAG: ABC transporter substrate-binding protein [Myxococcota bacterium]
MRRRLCFLLALVVSAGATPPPAAEAAGRRPYGGVVRVALPGLGGLDDPRALTQPGARWLASWTHCRLFRVDGRGRVRAELARDGGEMRGRTLTLRLVDGAQFHDGAVATATDVVQSLQSLTRSPPKDAAGAALAEMIAALEVRALDPATVEIRGPSRTDPHTIRRLLARPEAAILHGGTAARGHGCGPFRPSNGSASGVELVAHPGHPEGRPWLDRLEIAVRPDPRAQSAAFADGEVDLTPSIASRDRRDAASLRGALATVYAVVAPSLRGDDARVLRRNISALASEARLVRHSEWPAEHAESLWPTLLSPAPAAPPATGPALPQPVLVIAYPEGNASLAELARALRDALAPLSLTPARAVAVAGLDLRGAVTAKAPPWQLAVVSHEWQALDVEQAALELARALDRPGLTATDALTGRGRGYAAAQNEAAPAIPLLHLERPLHHRSWLILDGGTSAATGVDLGDAWRRP